MWNCCVTVSKCCKPKNRELSKRFKRLKTRLSRSLNLRTTMITNSPNSYMRKGYIMKIWGWARLRITKSISNKCRVWRIRVIKWCTKNIKRRGKWSVLWANKDRWRHALIMKVHFNGVNTSKSLERIATWDSHKWTTSCLWSKKWLDWTSYAN
jgi:hypothetical protein